MILKNIIRMQCSGLRNKTLFSNVFPKKLKKLKNLPRKPTYYINIINILLKKAERYVAGNSSSVIINYIVKNTSKCDVKQSPSMQPWV